MTDENHDNHDDHIDQAQAHLASLKRDMRKTLEDATVRAVHKVMADLDARSDKRMIQIEEAVVRQALEALEYIEHNYMSLPAPATKAITALRQALEQPAQQTVVWPTMPQSKGQSPVLFEDGYAEGWAKCLSMCKEAVATSPQSVQQQESSLQGQLDDALNSLAFYKRRVEALQQWQSKMRAPERTIVCDIIANGHTLEPAGDRYKQPAQQEPEGMAEFLADLQRSRTKYPKNGRMFDGLMGEVDELRRAYAGDGDMRAEAFDVAVCAFRIATEGDAGGNTMLKPAQQEPVAWTATRLWNRKDTWTCPANIEKDLLDRPPAREPLTDLVKAAQSVLEWTEIAHRPPVRDKLEGGRMVMVRLHALADLHDALAAHGIKGDA